MAAKDVTRLFEAILKLGDRVCLEDDNQKQADALAEALAAVDTARLRLDTGGGMS